MGGLGSGSWYRWDTRRMIDTVDCLDVRRLARQGALREGVQASITWRQGQQAECSLEVACESRGIVLKYRPWGVSGDWCAVQQEIAVEWVRTGFGRRALLRCSACRRRVARVYRSNRLVFVCRICMALPYKSQCEMLDDRLYRRMQKRRKRVGVVNGDMHQPVWQYPKPKGMHQSTYERLGELAEEARMEWLEAWNEKLLRLVSRYASVGEHITWGKG
jgi:hypothetical protein